MARIKIPTDTGYILKETVKGLPKATKKVGKAIVSMPMKAGKAIGRKVFEQLDKEMEFRKKMSSPKTPEQIQRAKDTIKLKPKGLK